MPTTTPEFDEFVRQHKRQLLSFATALSADPRQGEELVTDVLSKTWEHWDRIAAVAYPNAYVRKMIVNEFISWRRRLHRTRPVAELADYADGTSDHASALAERGTLIQRLGALPRKQRATLMLRFDEGMSDDEIAEILGCSPGTVRSNTARALATLRVRMQATRPVANPLAAPNPPSPRPDPGGLDPHAQYRRPFQQPQPIGSKGEI